MTTITVLIDLHMVVVMFVFVLGGGETKIPGVLTLSLSV